MLINELHTKYLASQQVITDSRQKVSNGIFFALKGERFNGNEFALQALENGCKWAVVDEDHHKDDARIIRVENVLRTLQQLAHYHRKTLDIPFLAITGSNGKTTTKELTNLVLGQKFNTQCTKGNYNNHIGVPLTLLSVHNEHEIAIIEMGANHIGEIAKLCEIAEPTHGIITNIGKAHLEGFGSLEGVIKAKTELYQSLHHNKGIVFCNAGNTILMNEIQKYHFDTIMYGFETENSQTAYYGKTLKNDPYLTCELIDQNHSLKIVVNSLLTGKYNLENIIAAFSIGRHFEVNTPLIKQALDSYQPSNARSQYIESKHNHILLDSYNANATSMQLAMDEFLQSNSMFDKIMILGAMKELGQYSDEEHKQIIRLAEQQYNVKTFFVGDEFLKHPVKHAFRTTEELITFLKTHPVKNHYVLLKGSRSIGLEKLLDIL